MPHVSGKNEETFCPASNGHKYSLVARQEEKGQITTSLQINTRISACEHLLLSTIKKKSRRRMGSQSAILKEPTQNIML